MVRTVALICDTHHILIVTTIQRSIVSRAEVRCSSQIWVTNSSTLALAGGCDVRSGIAAAYIWNM